MTRQEQTAAHPERGADNPDVFDIMTDIARAEVGCFDRDVDRRFPLGFGGIVPVRLCEGSVQFCREFARNPENGLAVREIRGNGDVPHFVVKSENLLHVRTGDGILRQNQNAVHAGTLEPVVVDAEFFAGAEHSV